VPIDINVVRLNSPHGEVYSIQHYVIKFCQWFSPISSINIADSHDITEILLKVVLNNSNTLNVKEILKIYLMEEKIYPNH
jgi:hypothetical protein